MLGLLKNTVLNARKRTAFGNCGDPTAVKDVDTPASPGANREITGAPRLCTSFEKLKNKRPAVAARVTDTAVVGGIML